MFVEEVAGARGRETLMGGERVARVAAKESPPTAEENEWGWPGDGGVVGRGEGGHTSRSE